MESEIAVPPNEQPVRGYQRAAVEEFLAAAEAERARLNALIAEANDRAARARAAVGMHHVMVSMLLETQEELARRRTEADQRAAEILAAAEAEALAIERAPAAIAPAMTVSPPTPVASAPTGVYEPPAAPEFAAMAPRLQSDTRDDDGEADRFFEFLRRALHDEEPLGPRPEGPT
ncbi:MAG: hypothetical protein JWL73_1505 [Actinomycetia bacterium]|nr:hypothetical protein [Actinomycetes bacterium]